MVRFSVDLLRSFFVGPFYFSRFVLFRFVVRVTTSRFAFAITSRTFSRALFTNFNRIWHLYMPPQILKVTVVGESGVGKSSLVGALAYGKSPANDPNYRRDHCISGHARVLSVDAESGKRRQTVEIVNASLSSGEICSWFRRCPGKDYCTILGLCCRGMRL